MFTTMPEQVVIAGTDIDNAKAVLNYGRFLDSIGTGKAGVAFSQTDAGKILLNKIMDAYESGSAADIKQIEEVFDETVKELLKLEGATDEQIVNLFKNVKQSSDETRAYFVDAAGDPTDGGFVQALIDQGKQT
jgi:DNA polymerase/3'-5' exonuclease PolX